MARQNAILAAQAATIAEQARSIAEYSQPARLPPPGWYGDAAGPEALRFWNGTAWADGGTDRAPGELRAVTPSVEPMATRAVLDEALGRCAPNAHQPGPAEA